jgi:hypothetical protein
MQAGLALSIKNMENVTIGDGCDNTLTMLALRLAVSHLVYKEGWGKRGLGKALAGCLACY